MFQLKTYQEDTLSVLREYLTEAKYRTPEDAFARVTKKYPSPMPASTYHPRWNLQTVPYVCLCLPTGGGKTFLAAHAVSVAAQCYLERETPFVLWLVPTNALRKQTAAALRRHDHPCRRVLDDAFGKMQVSVFDIEDINAISAKKALEEVCLVIATMQTLRVTDANKEARKVYGHNENFQQHFTLLPNTAPGLDRDEHGNVKFSFVNMLHQLRPLVIVDEAHKMISQLSGETMQRINPACVVEFTATPVESNVLYRVPSSALKAEEMVKLPFRLAEHRSWEEAVAAALATRARLEQLASEEAEYVRPLILFQAQKRNQTCTVETLKNFLVEQLGVREGEIAVATGDQHELDGIELFDPHCPIRYVITVEALKEGWDCSFAYVFCSVAHIASETDVEQLLGRVMRMPYARKRRQAELNMAYAHVMAPSFGMAAENMCACLSNMGFNEQEAASNIEQASLLPKPNPWDATPLGKIAKKAAADTTPPLLLTLARKPDLTELPTEEVEPLEVTEINGLVEVRSTTMLPYTVEERLVDAAAPSQKADIRRRIALHRQAVTAALPPSPAARGIPFAVPLLLVDIEGFWEPATSDTPWQGRWSPLEALRDGRAPLTSQEFAYNPQTQTYEFDLDGERLTYKSVDTQVQWNLYTAPHQQDALSLSRWLDRQCHAPDIAQVDMLEFCRRAVEKLLESGACDLSGLWLGKQLLAEALRRKIHQLREEARRKGYVQLLLAPTAKVEVRFDTVQAFPTSGYAEGCLPYSGAYQFRKHYFAVPRDLKSSGEEFRCAQAIDNHPDVELWLRNVPRQAGSFCLPTSHDNFYPDFIARLNDQRLLLIEYKGENLLSTDDTKEKVNIANLWAEKSQGRGAFLLVCETQDSYTFEKQMRSLGQR